MVVDRVYTADLEMVQLWLLDANGYMAGAKGTAWANGETVYAYVIEGRREATITEADANIVPIEEGGEQVGQWAFGGSAITRVEIDLADTDPVLIPMIGNTAADETTSSYYPFWTPEAGYADRPAAGALLTQRAIGDEGASNAAGFLHDMILKCTAVFQRGNKPFNNRTNNRLILTPIMSKVTPFGMPLSGMNLSVERGKVTALNFKSNRRVHFVGFKKDGTETDIITQFKPTSNSAVAATGPNLMFLNGAVTNPSSVTPATGTIVVAAGTGGHKVVMMHEHDNEEVA